MSSASVAVRSAGFSAPLDRLFACHEFADVRTHVLAPLARAIRASDAVFVQFLGLPLAGDAVGHRAQLGDANRSAVEDYAEGLYTVDPMVRPALESLHARTLPRTGSMHLLEDVAGWRDLASYRRFLERFDIGHVLAVAVPAQTSCGPQVLCLGFHRPVRAAPFSPGDTARLRRLIPPLQAVLSNLAHTEAERLTGRVLDELVECGAGTGLMVLDQDLRLRHANRRMLAELGAESDRSGGLGADGFGALRKRLLDSPPPAGTSVRTVLELGGGGTRPRRLEIEIRTFRNGDGGIYYMLAAPEAGSPAGEPLGARHGLTRRETEVAELVCEGRTSPQIARQLGISRRTVENHLRAVYDKIGINSRAQLITRMLAS
jgi:DNA-binding CsgD family transcriptional regulator